MHTMLSLTTEQVVLLENLVSREIDGISCGVKDDATYLNSLERVNEVLAVGLPSPWDLNRVENELVCLRRKIKSLEDLLRTRS